MAVSKSLIACLFLSLFIVDLIHANEVTTEIGNIAPIPAPTPTHPPPPPKIDCTAECERRCRLSKRMNVCKRACGTCCARCDCVPPGTYGHYETCPCYGNMTTHGGRHKCP